MINVELAASKVMEELLELDAQRKARQEKLKEILDKQAKSFKVVGKLLLDSLNIEHLLKLNGSNSYSQTVVQDGKRYRLAISIPPANGKAEATAVPEEQPKKRRRGRPRRGE
jgi:hypothetical protein